VSEERTTGLSDEASLKNGGHFSLQVLTRKRTQMIKVVKIPGKYKAYRSKSAALQRE
jgi:hypothetical protein